MEERSIQYIEAVAKIKKASGQRWRVEPQYQIHRVE
jgi:hypothetical protein